MKVKNNTFPHPVLSKFTEDYQTSNFDLDIEVVNEFNQYYLMTNFVLENDYLNQLIEERKIAFSIHIECSQTNHRENLITYKKNEKIKLNNEVIKGKIEINGLLIAMENMDDYTNDDLDDLFYEMAFNIVKGNILGVTDRTDAILFESSDDYKDMNSIISIRKSSKNEYMEIDINSDKIIISLPEKDYLRYAKLAKSDFKDVIISNVIFPSLVYVFSQVENSKDEFDANRWYQVMSNILEQSGVDIEEIGVRGDPSYVVVQKLLHNPLSSSLEAIEMFANRGEE